VLHCHQVAISSRFRDNGHQTYWGHDLDLSGSRDVIGHVTIGLGMGHFLLVVLRTQFSISNGFRDIPLQTSCAHRHNAKSSLRMRVSRDMYPYVKFKYIFQFLTPTLPIHHVTFIALRWRIRGVLSLISNVKGQIERKIFKSKNLQNFDLLGALEIRGYEMLRFLLQKVHPCVKTRRLSHFASVEGSEPQSWEGKKVRKSRTPIGMMCRR